MMNAMSVAEKESGTVKQSASAPGITNVGSGHNWRPAREIKDLSRDIARGLTCSKIGPWALLARKALSQLCANSGCDFCKENHGTSSRVSGQVNRRPAILTGHKLI